MLQVRNEENGKRFNVRLLNQGDKYGLDYSLTHMEDMPLVEFYDADQSTEKFGPLGQFVSRYYLKDILQHTGGLSLNLGIPEWYITDHNFTKVLEYVLNKHLDDVYK
jgi:hypothetical protein